MKTSVLISLLMLFFSLELVSQQKTIQYRYDNLNRLVLVNYGNGITTKYSYDELGNRTSQETTVIPLQINVSNKSTCQGKPIELGTFDSEHNPVTVTGGSGDYEIMWYPSNGLLNPNSQNPTVLSPQYSGSYTINVRDRVTQEFSSGTLYLNVNRPPTVGLPPLLSIRRGTSVFLGDRLTVNGGQPPYLYYWTDKLGWSSNLQNPYVTFSNAGSFRFFVTVTDANGCISQEKNIQVSVRNRDSEIENLYSEWLSIYPNPTKDIFNLEINFEKKVNVELFLTSLLGITLQEFKFHEIENIFHQIDLTNYSTGVYYLKINVNGELFIEKIIKQ